MTDNPVRSAPLEARVAVVRFDRSTALLALFCAAAVLSGCAERKPPTLPWKTASVVRPRIPVLSASALVSDDEAAQENPPELRVDLSPPTMPFPPPSQLRPARPRLPTTQPAPSEPGKPQTPFVVPQLSVEESTTAQQETNVSLSAAEKSVEITRGKSLNAAQADMASKIAGFIADAHAAAANGDWPSARNLARKAQLLSEELAKSLQ